MNDLQHNLAKLSLNKPTQTFKNSKFDPQNKSISSKQANVKELHKGRQELYHYKSECQQAVADTRGRYHQSRTSHKLSRTASSIPSERKSSEFIHRRHSQRVCLPSNPEEEPDNIREEAPRPRKNSITASISLHKHNTESIGSKEDGTSSPSRGSTSSNTAPLTEEEDQCLPPKYPYSSSTKEHYYRTQQYTSREMPDPLYYQRLHLQQLQLQYQQQLYLMSQTPIFFLSPYPSPSSPLMTDPSQLFSPIMMQQLPLSPSSSPVPPSPPQLNSSHHTTKKKPNKHHSTKLTSTDLRRRADILRNSSESYINRYNNEKIRGNPSNGSNNNSSNSNNNSKCQPYFYY
ncbi:uncharacterized protein BX663DRAFT_508234 [Cokeromyces recurvatus]|uniref:uncharacterized protein n=1 Tax=Cokeromyces recurvatus TaxID=90255 RepID=UPI00221FEA08|nr:uncharacterized protein BX663DRAFT_508234 [Cokeromyces recurvatus]KAI7903325.1 hypothetical protein BX663DRAFT_508234 [Cokeromyces recurvatus]